MAIADHFVWILESDSSKLKTDIDDSKQKVEDLGSSAEKTEKAVKKTTEAAKKSNDSVGTSLKKLAGAYLTYATATKVVNTVDSFVKSTLALKSLSDQTGIAIEDMDGLQKGLQRVGVDSASTAQAVTGIANAIGSEADLLEKAGIAAKDSQGNFRDTLDVLGDISEMSSHMDSKEATAFFKSLKITDPNLINNLRKGRGELENLIRAEKIKGVVDKEQLELAKKYDGVSKELSAAIGEVADSFSKFLLPIFTKVKSAFIDGIAVLSKHGGFIKIFAGLLTTVAVPALLLFYKAQLKAAAIPLLIVAGLAALALAIDDVSNFFQGNGSKIEDWAKKFGYTQEQIDGFRELVIAIFNRISEHWNDLIDAFADAPDKISSILSSISNTFRDKFNGIKAIIKEWVDTILDWLSPLVDAISGIFNGAKSIGGMIGNLFGSNKPSSTSSAPVQEAAEMMNSARNVPTNTISNSSIQNSKSSNQTNNQTNNITINSTADPKAIADKVKTSTKDGLSEFARQNRGGSLN